MGGRGEPQNSKNLPRRDVEFGKTATRNLAQFAAENCGPYYQVDSEESA